MKYKSELIKEIVDTRGHELSSLHYESECVGAWVEEAKGAYPKLCDYESEWLNYINESPIGNFPYETVTANPTATINNVVPYAYKSAILKGHTLINLINSTQNIEFSKSAAEAKEVYTINNFSPRKLNVTVNTQPSYWYYIIVKINVDLLKPNTKYLIKAKNLNNIASAQICEGSGSNKLAVQKSFIDNSYAIITTNDLSTLNGKEILYLVITDFKKNTIEYPTTISVEDIMLIEYQEGMENWDIPYFEGMKSVKMPVLTTSNEDGTKSNILTVNEDVELRGVGDVKDELNLLTGELTQRIGEIVFDGTEKWERFTRDGLSTPAYRITLSTNSNKQYNTTHIKCNMVVANGQAWADGEHLWIDNYNNLTLHTDRFNSLEDFKSYLNNSNLIVQYTVNESVKTVDLSIQDQDGNTLRKIKPIEGTMHITASGTPINPGVSLEVPVEAITQNLSSFIGEE